jgi:hypothetical protein
MNAEFMEVLTVIHLTWVLVVPCFLALGAVLFNAFGPMLALNGGGMFGYVFAFIFLIVCFGEVFDTLSQAPYFETRMIQFQGIDQPVDRMMMED